MKQCRKCSVYVDDDLTNCPLCGALAHEETSPTIYEYPTVDLKKQRKLFLKISLFISTLPSTIRYLGRCTYFLPLQ